jgi:hypothetical protein
VRLDHGQRPAPDGHANPHVAVGDATAAHGHVHEHAAHGHAHLDEGPMGTSDPGTVVLDIGGTTGAIVVITPPRLHGAEIEIRHEGAAWSGAHTAVRERRAGDRVQFAGVFPRLDAGAYELRMLGRRSGVILPVSVDAGAVVETWLDAPVD